MNLAQYPALAARTEKVLPTDFQRLEHASLGVTTETGEIATCVKRIVVYGKKPDDLEKDGKTTIREHILEEIGDVLWYLPIIGSVFGNQEAFERVSDGEFTRYAGDEDLASALASVTRRLQIAAGRIAQYVEEYQYVASRIDPTFEARNIVELLHELCWLIGADLGEIAAANIAKLQERFPEAYSDTAAEARADKGGLDAHNS